MSSRVWTATSWYHFGVPACHREQLYYIGRSIVIPQTASATVCPTVKRPWFFCEWLPVRVRAALGETDPSFMSLTRPW